MFVSGIVTGFTGGFIVGGITALGAVALYIYLLNRILDGWAGEP